MDHLSRRGFFGAAVALAMCGPATAQTARPASRVALKGYDAMSYFTEGKPEQGSQDFTFAYDDTVYWFKSAAHRDKFATDPERYAPQFDGYCAIQLSRGLKVEADPEAWAITNGKLYVFSKKPAVQKFASGSTEIIEQANQNWPQIKKP